MKRLHDLPTLRINPSEQVSFTYRGKDYQGLAGDTIATAMYANGIRIFSRSIKYHRPRGLYSLDGESGNCLMEVDATPNIRTEQTPLRNGMIVKPQNVIGIPEMDLMGIMDMFHWVMPAGFYYRVFHKPYWLWPFFMGLIRRSAGIGKINPALKERSYDELYLNCEVCVVGGGPAGISAALTAAEKGLWPNSLKILQMFGSFLSLP